MLLRELELLPVRMGMGSLLLVQPIMLGVVLVERGAVNMARLVAGSKKRCCARRGSGLETTGKPVVP